MDEFEKVYYYVHYVYNLQARRPVIREDCFAWVREQKIPCIDSVLNCGYVLNLSIVFWCLILVSLLCCIAMQGFCFAYKYLEEFLLAEMEWALI